MNTEENINKDGFEETAKKSFENFNDAFQRGKEDAFSKAQEAAPKLKETIAALAYEAAYGAAFGAFFASTFAQEIIPENVKDGLKKGAKAGKSAASGMKEEFNQTGGAPAKDGENTVMV